MKLEEKSVFIFCVNLFIILLFFEISNITLCAEPSFFILLYFLCRIYFFCVLNTITRWPVAPSLLEEPHHWALYGFAQKYCECGFVSRESSSIVWRGYHGHFCIQTYCYSCRYSCCCLQNLCMSGGDHGFDLQFDNGSMRLTHKKTVISHKFCTHFWSSKLSHKKKKDKTERFTHRFSK